MGQICLSISVATNRRLDKHQKSQSQIAALFCRKCPRRQPNSSGASGGCLHGGASFKVEKAHLEAPKKTMTATDVTGFDAIFSISPLDFALLSPDFRGLVLLNCT